VPDLILLRHGQSAWNELNLFTGWTDVDLTTQGESEPEAPASSWPPKPTWTCESCTPRSSRGPFARPRSHSTPPTAPGCRFGATGASTSATTAISPARTRRKPRTNSALSRSCSGAARTTFPAADARGDPRSSLTDPRYRDVPAEFIPATECLKDVVARVTPYFADVIVEDLRSEAVRGGAVIVVAHGNSLRALRMVLQNIPEDEIAELEIRRHSLPRDAGRRAQYSERRLPG